MLTPRQQQCLDAIRSHLAAHGHGPSYGEIAAALGLQGRGAVVRLVNKLRDRGFITWNPGHARSISLTGKTVTQAAGDLPLVALSHAQAAEIDAMIASRNYPSRAAVVNWLIECALYQWTHGSLPPLDPHNAAPFGEKARVL